MGVKLLTTFLKTQDTGDGIKKIELKSLSGKKIAVDIFIYMYRFLKEDKLLENIYLMCFTFRKYNIIPLFVFDGFDINEKKKDEITKRKAIKTKAMYEYEKIKKSEIIDSNMKEKMNILYKQMITLTKKDVESAKLLIKGCGMRYITAHGESDILCSALVKSNKVYACLTEDSDLFVYNCPRVIKYLSLLNHTCLLYDLKKILCIINITYEDLLNISILSGTDYNNQISGDIFCNKNYLLEYKNESINKTFLDWMLEKKRINSDDIKTIYEIKKCYTLDVNTVLKTCPYIIIKNYDYNYNKIRNILERENFIFI
tara:strand:- start:1245 stop:2186 length:942 start_codon:yes stop_codon:yes gene_type:complete